MMPTGGDADRIPPNLVRSQPTDGTVGFTGTTILLDFDEYVDLNSFRTALRFEPNLNIRYTVRWKGKQARIRLGEPLPENTTVVLVLEKGVRDVRGNSIPTPIRLAFSSGERIDNGSVTVKVLHPETGRRVDLIDVFLYRGDTSLDEPATYTSQSDTGGTVTFRNLPEDTYRMVAVADLNRNRIIDLPREAAYPYRSEFIDITQDSLFNAGQWFVARTDSSKPAMEGLGLMGPDRLRLRFSKSVLPGTGSIASRTDTLNIRALHSEVNDRTVWYYHSERPLVVGQRYEPYELAISDSLGNPTTWTSLFLDAEILPDTVRTRFLALQPIVAINPTDSFFLVFNRPGKFTQVIDSLVLTADRQIVDGFTTTVDLNRIVIAPTSPWPEGVTLSASVFDATSGRTSRPNVRIQRLSDRGDLTVHLPDSTSAYLVNIRTANGILVQSITSTDKVLVQNLSIGSYVVSCLLDENGNGRFDTGRLIPFQAPEVMVLERRVQIKAGFESELRFR